MALAAQSTSGKTRRWSLRPHPPGLGFETRPFLHRQAGRAEGLSFFQRHNPILRHPVLRKRTTLEYLGLLDRIAVDIWPSENERLPMFDGLARPTFSEFDVAYAAAREFAVAYAKGPSLAASCNPCSNSESAPVWPAASPLPRASSKSRRRSPSKGRTKPRIGWN